VVTDKTVVIIWKHPPNMIFNATRVFNPIALPQSSIFQVGVVPKALFFCIPDGLP
jgi:hypothetical protein